MTQAIGGHAPAPGRPRLALAWLLALPMIIVCVIGFSVALGWVRGDDIAVLALALITGAVSCIPIILDVGRPSNRRHLLLGFFLVSHLVFFVASVFLTYFFADIVVRREEYGYFDLKAIQPTDIANGQLRVLVGLLVLLAGYAVPIGKLVPGGIPRPRRDWTYQATLSVAMIMIPIGWIVFLSTQYGILPKRVGSGIVGQLGNATFVGIALLMLSYLRHRSRTTFALMAVLIPPTMVINFFTGAKGLFFAPAAVALIAYIVATGRIRIRWFVVAFIAMSLFYPIGEFQRQVILQGNTRTAAYALRRPIEVFSRTLRFVSSADFNDYLLRGIASTSIRFDGLGVASVIVRDCPARVPFQGAWSLGYIALAYVPRIVWADKPEMVPGLWVTETFGPGRGVRSHTGSTWVGELWYSYGWQGVVIGMFLMGVFLRIFHEALFQYGAVIPAQLMAVIVLFTLPPTLNGALMGTVNSIVFATVPLMLTHWGVRLLGGAPLRAPGVDQPPGDLAAQADSGILASR